MNPIKIMINGMPGNVALNVAGHAMNDERFELIDASLTGPEITQKELSIGSKTFRLLTPDNRDEAIAELKDNERFFISIDYTHPSAVNSNVDFYCRNELPFVMGTTGGDRDRIKNTVDSSAISAVVAPNMAKQIVGFQAMMEYASETFPGLFNDYTLELKESHQKGKADTSGTAKAMLAYFNKMGIPFSEDDIIKERDPSIQKGEWGIPDEYLGGHAWHTYTLVSKDQTTRFSFTHNINGRDIYAHGTLDAVYFLNQKIKEGLPRKMYTMIDVMKG